MLGKASAAIADTYLRHQIFGHDCLYESIGNALFHPITPFNERLVYENFVGKTKLCLGAVVQDGK